MTLLWFILYPLQAADCRGGLVNVQRSLLPHGLKCFGTIFKAKCKMQAAFLQDNTWMRRNFFCARGTILLPKFFLIKPVCLVHRAKIPR